MAALQSSGAISLANVQAEFGGANPISMSEYYKGGSYVPSAAPGPWTSYYGIISSGSNWYWNSDGYIYWDGTYITGSAPYSGQFVSGSYTYEIGTQFDFVDGGKNDPGVGYSTVRRRVTALDIAPNVPTSGSISFSDFYGAGQ